MPSRRGSEGGKERGVRGSAFGGQRRVREYFVKNVAYG